MRRRRLSTPSGDSTGNNANKPRAGDVVGGYKVVEQIASGGMGWVYRVEHVGSGQVFAMKVLRARYAFDADVVSRFFLEADAIASLAHVNVVAVADFVDAPPWPPGFVMELLEGRTLAEALDEEGPLSVARAVGVAVAVASALAAVHDAALVHRDLKPENVFLARRDGGELVKVLDFGVAKLLDNSLDRRHQTALGRQLGTPGYMAPEQLLGTADLDNRADVYGLGVLLYEALTGRLPFDEASTQKLLRAIATVEASAPSRQRPADLDAVPPALDALVLACLKKSPADRPQSIRQVHAALASLLPPGA